MIIPKNALLNSFTTFSEIIQFNLKIFYSIAVFNLIKQFV